MKQVVQNFRSGELKVDEVPAPVVRPGSLLVANHFSLISAGTEKSTVSVAKKNLVGKAMERPEMVKKVISKARKDGLMDTMKMVFARLDTPAALGYSCAGTVIEAGSGIDGFVAGDRVACAGQNYASHAEVVSVPGNLCVAIPDGVDSEDAAYVTMGAIALQGVRQAEPRLGDIVAVIGLGLLGQLTVQMLKANGCIVIASDIDPDKLDLAGRLGADVTVLSDQLEAGAASLSGGHGVDSVVITASTRESSPVEVAGEIARKKGRVVIVGAVGMNLPREPYYIKELELRLSTSYGPGRYDNEYEEKGHDYPYGYVRWTEKRNMEAFLALIQQGKVDVKSLTTHSFDISDAEKPYRIIMENSEPFLGILLSYSSHKSPNLERDIVISSTQVADKVNMGIIGAGSHVKDMLLPALKGMKGVQIRAICTGNGINAKALASKISAAYCTSDYSEVLKDETVNAVLIGTRNNVHGRMVKHSLETGKHVFVEKPLCLTQAELDAITEELQQQGADAPQLMVGLNRRFSVHAQKAIDFYKGRNDPLVMVYRVNAGALPHDHWTQDPEVGGGRILGEACHFIDYLQVICGSKPVSVHARSIQSHSSGITSDHTVISLSFADGSIGTVIYAAGGDAALPKERCELFADGKSAVMDDFLVSEFYAGGKKSTFRTRGRDKGFSEEMKRFCTGIMSGVPAMPFDDIVAVTRACLLAVESQKTGKVYEF